MSSSFSSKRSSLPSKISSRTQPGLCPSSALVDKALGYLSILTGTATICTLIGLQFILIPSAIAAKLGLTSNWFNNKARIENQSRNTEGSPLIEKKNISNTETGSLTALKTLSARSTTARVGINPDYLAPKLMGKLSLYGNGIIGSYFVSQIYLQMTKWHFDLTKRFIADQIVVLFSRWGVMELGENAYLQCRTCWIDDCLETFLLKHSNVDDASMDQDLETIYDTNGQMDANVNVVALGSGYDTRAYRFSKYFKANFFEIDAIGTQVSKRKALQDAHISEGSTIFISCDFTSENWLNKLIQCGLNPDLPTFLIWEGVTMYLKSEVVEQTLHLVGSKLGKGSCIAFDYLDSKWALSDKIVKMSTKAGEPFQFGLHGKEGDDLIEKTDGLSMLEHKKRDDLVEMYLPKHYDSRPVGFLGDFGGFILAGR